MFENKKIFIFGMARSGYEAAKLLANYNNEIVITDGKEQNIDHVKELESLGVKVIITENQIDLIDESFDYMIKNPGIISTNPVVLKAKELGIKVINEVEMAYHFLPDNVKIIGITGSNGKTTTTTMIYEMLHMKYENVYLGGNIGYPLSQIVKDIKDDSILVMEISDHQLCDMYEFKTDISLLLNLVHAHIDFHGTYEKYKEMKSRIFNHHTENDIAILNYNNEDVLELTKDIKSKKMYFSNDTEKDIYIKENTIYYKNEEVINLDNIRLKGIHNYENIMASILVLKEFDVENEIIEKYLSKFNGVEHRIEYVRTLNNRDFYNDSKSTNNEATITALKTFKTPTILIMGGLDRNIPFDELKDYLNNVKTIVCYGETKEKINEFSKNNNIDCYMVDELKEATIKAYEISSEGDTILLSPACASWDQFKSFEDRGNLYKEIVNNLE
ncbi:MAG: UDP-N-acetylmuramoyl-L-alanine--D-glutamate ligase [Lactobacillales bacterium]|nr:UDP-N-acetylmuramoyl-L-alanine--D-glutamate ligase [Lactobacillales bacterium]